MSQGNHPDHPPVEGGYRGDNKRERPAGATHMVICNEVSGSVFVKEIDFFESQGGFVERWGEKWVPVTATSVESAREAGCAMFTAARPYHRQAPPDVIGGVRGRYGM